MHLSAQARRQLRHTVLLATGALLGVSGCSASPSNLTSPSSGARVPTAANVVVSPSSRPPTDAGASSDSSAVAASVGAAEQALTAYCRPHLTRARWLDALSPYLTQDAAAAYATVDPARVACSGRRGAGRVVEGDAAFTMRVAAGTDAGTYTVWLSRPGVGRPWLVDRFVPPGRR